MLVNAIKEVVSAFRGKKTYLVAVAAGVVVVLELTGVVDAVLRDQLLVALGITGTITLRMGISNK